MECYNYAGCDPGPCPAYTTPSFFVKIMWVIGMNQYKVDVE